MYNSYNLIIRGHTLNIKIQPMGDYQTNCYIVTIDEKNIIIDPGINAF